MLQNIRKNIQGTMAKVIVALIIVPFALFGIESLLGGGGPQNVAEVNGNGIDATVLQQEINRQKRRMMSSMGDQIDPAMLDDQMLSGPALEFIIQKELLLQAADRYGMAISDQKLAGVVAEIPAFQTGGQFDPVLYRRVLQDQGYSPGMFKQTLRDDMLMTQLRAGLASSQFVTEGDVALFSRFTEQQRDLRFLVMPLDDFREDAEITEEQISEWYEANPDRFQTTESVVVDYIELTLDDFREPVDADAVRELYELEKDSFERAEERLVSHILFEQRDGETDEALQERIDAVRELALAGDTSFAELAREYSDDIGSANLGGEIGYTSGETFPPEIEEVVAVLEEGQVSEATESDSGWHLLLVQEIRQAETVEFAAVQMELEQRLQSEQARSTLVKQVESLRDLVFNAEDLQGPAEELGLTVQRSKAIERNTREGLFSNARILAAAFSDEVLNDSYNSEVLELGEQHYLVLRMVEHKLPELRPLEEVREEVVATLREESARAAIAARAEELLSQLRSGSTLEELALANEFEWQVELGAKRDNPVVPRSMLQRAFELPEPGEGGTFEYVQNSEGDIELFQLVRIIEVDPSALPAARRDGIRQGLLNQESRVLDAQYQEQLRAQADIVTLL